MPTRICNFCIKAAEDNIREIVHENFVQYTMRRFIVCFVSVTLFVFTTVVSGGDDNKNMFKKTAEWDDNECKHAAYTEVVHHHSRLSFLHFCK